MKEKSLIIILLVFSLGIRVWNLDKNPAGFYVDEALVGYNGYKIANTLRDAHGEFLPIFFRAYSYEGISPYSVYLPAITVKLLGLNEFSVRLVSVICTTFSILFFYLILKEFLSGFYPLLGGLMLSVSPWCFYLGRTVLADFYAWLLLTIISCYLLFVAIRRKRLLFFVLTGVFFALCSYSYFPSRMITPLLLIFLTPIVYLRSGFKRMTLVLIAFLLVLTPFISYHFFNENGFNRMKQTTGFDLRNLNSTNLGAVKERFVRKYFAHYSDDYLFTKGDADYPGQIVKRQSIKRLGLLYPYEKFLIVFGLITYISMMIKSRRWEMMAVILIFILFPIADSLTLETAPYSIRSYIGVIAFQIFAIFGWYGVSLLLKRLKLYGYWVVRLGFWLLVLVLLCNSMLVLKERFEKTDDYSYWGWQFGPREVIGYFRERESDFDELIMAGTFDSPVYYFRFYAPESCSNCFAGGLDKFDPNKKQLFAVTRDLFNKIEVKKLYKVIYFPNGDAAFYIVEISGLKLD